MNIEHIAGVCLSFLKTTSSPPVIFGVLFLFSLTIALVKILLSLFKTLWFKKKIKQVEMQAIIKKLSLKHNLKNKIIIFQNSKPYAFCLGIKNPRIYLSSNLLKVMNQKEIEAIILHEKYHLMKKDVLLTLIATFAKGLFFLFPMLSDIIISFIRQKEADADRYSISYFKHSKIVLSAFRKLLLNDTKNIPSLAYLVSFSHVDTLDHRIKILKGQKSFVLSFKIKHILISLISFIAIFSFFFISSKPAVARQNVSTSVCLKEHNCHSECSP